MFAIGTNGLAAYAGSAAAGEDAIAGLSTRLERTHTIMQFTSATQRIILDVWRAYQPNRDGLEIIFGFSNPSGMAWLGHFSSVDDFALREVDDMAIIGPEPAQVHFSQALRAIVAENAGQIDKRAFSYSVGTMASMVMGAVHDACELGAHENVGGRIVGGWSHLGKVDGGGLMRARVSAGELVVENLGIPPEQAKMVQPARWRHDSEPEAEGTIDNA
jgi:hypothetical protein